MQFLPRGDETTSSCHCRGARPSPRRTPSRRASRPQVLDEIFIHPLGPGGDHRWLRLVLHLRRLLDAARHGPLFSPSLLSLSNPRSGLRYRPPSRSPVGPDEPVSPTRRGLGLCFWCVRRNETVTLQPEPDTRGRPFRPPEMRPRARVVTCSCGGRGALRRASCATCHRPAPGAGDRVSAGGRRRRRRLR
ncbi:hypothetical protein SETIT_8G208600v2 [Setaria italica]|uniref:Uncharacterized protein n=1 Tax=Setaria italica TaxID=4555 RepID=A0A368SA55_SETIT|nr:hypothetical protein SETIT_8G208600v2 [Setaria italica]